MHDIGKIGIPDGILLKPEKLDANEWEIMKTHTVMGSEIIGDHPSPLLQLSRIIAVTHHEKWDGTGYPYGLAAEEIPLEGRIVAVADVFDALTSYRPYKKEWSVEDAMQLIDEESGRHFEPLLVSLLHEVLPEVVEIKKKYAEADLSMNSM